MSWYGHENGRHGGAWRHLAGLRCRPLAGVATALGSEHEWRFEVVLKSGGTAVVEVAGEIDLRTGAMLRQGLFELTDQGFGRIVIDFASVRFCDAAGLGVLVSVQNRLRRQGGTLALARVRSAQRRLLDVAGLDRLFSLYDSVPDAVRAEQKPTTAPLG
ncbi:MAG TPA: STAS domain-containing protein [Streptosporangiaceae bacterium]